MNTTRISRSNFDAIASLSCFMHEYVLRYALVAQTRASDLANGYRLAFAQKTGWRLEFNGVVTSSGDASKVYDVARRTAFNYFLRAGHDLREEAAQYTKAAA